MQPREGKNAGYQNPQYSSGYGGPQTQSNLYSQEFDNEVHLIPSKLN